jgi:hypothetical protein
VAGESRSQYRNRQAALDRLRRKIALRVREPINLSSLPDPAILAVSARSADYPAAMGKTLDALEYAAWSVSDGAKLLGVSTGRLIGFLRTDAQLWMEVNQRRQEAGLRGLNA